MSRGPRSGGYDMLSNRGGGRRGGSGPRGPGGRRGGPPGDRGESGSPLPNDYLANGYFDEQSHIRRDIVIETAKEVAERIARDRRLIRKKIASSAIRSFFSHVRALEAKLDGGKAFSEIRPGIWRLRSMAEYQKQRREPPVNQTFVDFISRNVDLADKDEKHFRAFVKHFESVLAFFPRQ